MGGTIGVQLQGQELSFVYFSRPQYLEWYLAHDKNPVNTG